LMAQTQATAMTSQKKIISFIGNNPIIEAIINKNNRPINALQGLNLISIDNTKRCYTNKCFTLYSANKIYFHFFC
jgi:hypothetical protein